MQVDLTGELKREALRIGCSAVGVARAETLVDERGHLLEWLARGFHASMGWMERSPDRRTDPALVLPGVRSVVSVAINYYTPDQHSGDPSVGKVSRYAWGDDYHDVVGEKLAELERFLLRHAPGEQTRSYVDTGPVMDKVWAARAGIGWIGKHTNVITRRLGSWVFLGTILTTAELDPDSPETDMCGTCTACLDACPTDALNEPYVLDSNKCISYLTIEHRGEISPELAVDFDRWIFGCDICQDVCPWNRFQKLSSEPRFTARPGSLNPSLGEVAELSQEKFSERFRGSPIKRTKVSGLTRNAKAVIESSAKNAHLIDRTLENP